MSHYPDIRELIARVRRRWFGLVLMRATVRSALSVALVAGVAMIAARWTLGAPPLLAAIGIVAIALALTAVVWGVLPLRRRPDDRQVARYIEERAPSLDDRLVTAVDIARQTSGAPALAEPMLADAARRAREVNVDSIVPRATLRRGIAHAAGALAVLLAVFVSVRQTARQAVDAATVTLFPARVTIEVRPGNARVRSGTTLTISARLVGNTAPVAAQLLVADGDSWRAAGMSPDGSGGFRLPFESVSAPFRYRVVAGAITSPAYDIAVVRPPRVARIDVDYTYPAGLRLPPRTERDSGDIYAPAGTNVRIHIVTDRQAAAGELRLSGGQVLALTPGERELTTEMKVTDDSSYRVALTDNDGLATAGETEYFIRTLEDRAPDVRITKPATDRPVTRLEEVDVEAQAEDDYGVASLDFVYSVRGESEKVVPFSIPRNQTTVAGRHTLYLEELDLQPGDFISYYVRARDLTRGTRPNEARSDIFFLEVKPYEQEFALAQSQASASGGGGRNSIDELVAAQKEIIVATWKLDRRGQAAKGAKSEQDIRSVAKAESELKARVEQASSAFREGTMRDPRRRTPQRGGRGGPPSPEPLRAGETLPEEDQMTAAAGAMGQAVGSLEDLKTADARAPEMEALNHLLKAQADVKKREVVRQQSGSGNASNRSNYDLSTLFDKELQKQQQTNYETRSTAEQRDDPNQSALDKIRDLAQRQDELLKQQQELSRNRAQMSEEELRRQLEKLTREQSELRQRAEEIARQMQPGNGEQRGSQSSQGSQGSEGSRGSQGSQGSEGSRGSQGSQGSEGSRGSQSSPGSQGSQGSDRSRSMREVSDAMRAATNDLRRQDQGQAAASANRALERLRDLERQMQAGRPDERRRAAGEAQLEARQLADAQRQIASELNRAGGEAPGDSLRRMAGDQERLAGRARRLQDTLKRQGGSGTEAAAELERQKLAQRMQQSADALRNAAERETATQRGPGAPGPRAGLEEAKRQQPTQHEMARTLDRLADRLATSSDTKEKDADAGKLSEQIGRAQELQDRINSLTNELKELSRSSGRSTGGEGQGQSGRANQGRGAGAGGSGDSARLRDEAQRALQETRELMEQLRRQDPTISRGGAGFTFEGQGMTTTAPGTEAFKQDFAKWEDLRRQATQALEAAQTSLSKKLQAREAKERLAAGAEDKAPPEYQKQVDDYFKAIAAKKKGG